MLLSEIHDPPIPKKMVAPLICMIWKYEYIIRWVHLQVHWFVIFLKTTFCNISSLVQLDSKSILLHPLLHTSSDKRSVHTSIAKKSGKHTCGQIYFFLGGRGVWNSINQTFWPPLAPTLQSTSIFGMTAMSEPFLQMGMSHSLALSLKTGLLIC